MLARLFILACVVGCCTAQSQTLVTGTVVGPDGSPAPSASVEAFPIRSSGFAGDLKWTKTDDHGNFRLALQQGRYEFRGKSEAAGYPDPNALLSFDSRALFPEITVSEEEIQGVLVRLGSRGGILEGEIRNKATGEVIPKARITIRDVKKREAFVDVFSDGKGHFEFTVPGKPLEVTATAPGYRPAAPEEGQQLRLEGGERRTVTVELDPK